MARILRKFNINVYTYPYKIIGNILPKIKDSVDDIQKKSVNRIPLKRIYRFIAYKSEIPNQILSLIK